MRRGEIYFKNVMVQIFRDHWDQFKRYNKEDIDKNIEENVEKMLGCGLLENGYYEYICTNCLKKKKIGFSCKSRFCLGCSKVYIDKWVGRMQGVIFKRIKHRHIILTVPGSLWEYFHEGKMLKKLSDCGVKTIKEVMEVCNKGKVLKAGMIVVTQTAGRASNWNPHLHMLVTEGGLDERGRWQDFYWFEYEILRKKWMYNLLKMVKEEYGGNEEVMRRVEEIYERRKGVGLIARAKKEKVRKRDIVGYLIKYVVSPPIALSRITGYDGESVTYYYREHPTERKVTTTVSAYEFIRRMIQHIPEKGMKLVRHYGLYAFRVVRKIREKLKLMFGKVRGVAQEFQKLFKDMVPDINYRERVIRSFGKDPLRCDSCGKEMELWRIWHPMHGVVYRYEDNCIPIIEGMDENKKEEKEGWSTQPQIKQLCFAF